MSQAITYTEARQNLAETMFQSTVAPSADWLRGRRDRGRADRPSLKGGVTEKDFIGSAVLSTSLFPLKVEVSNHKEIFDEEERFVMTSKLSTGPVRGAASS